MIIKFINSKWFARILLVIIFGALAIGVSYLDQKYKKSFPEVASGWSTFTSSNFGFSIQYPKEYTAEMNYTYSNLGHGKDIFGVSFTIPENYTTGTNLSDDSRISVESLPSQTDCSAEPFLDNPQNIQTLTENGAQYSVADSVSPAAGNIYEEKVYALVGSKPCAAIRYFIHSGNIYNYPAGAVKEFDKEKLLKEFDQIRKTLVIK